MITSTVSYSEIIWTVASIIGLLFNGRQLRRAVGDLSYVKRRRINSIREYSAMTTTFMFFSWTFVQAIFVALGIIALVSHNSTKPSPSQYGLTMGFIAVSIFLALAGFIIDTRRRELIEKIRSIEDDMEEN